MGCSGVCLGAWSTGKSHRRDDLVPGQKARHLVDAILRTYITRLFYARYAILDLGIDWKAKQCIAAIPCEGALVVPKYITRSIICRDKVLCSVCTYKSPPFKLIPRFSVSLTCAIPV